jgi:MoaA/NifB/PqqE/SkfB family radical SAM enzyme
MMLDNVKEIHIEPTSLCNAQCPMCARNIYGEKLNPYIKLKSLPVTWFHDNIKPSQIKNLNKIFFCGNVGDPASAPELIEIIKYFKKHNDKITIGLNTNGGLKTTEWWTRLGHTLQGHLDYCVFSIDGLEDTNHVYRRNVRWTKIMENVQSFIATGASAHWDMLVFEHNKHQVEEAKELADQMGFTWFRTKETDRWDTYTQDLGIQPANDYQPASYGRNISCEKDRDNSVFLDYTGKYWPCCHMAEAYLSKIGFELHSDIREHDNNELLREYKARLTTDTPFYICKRACGTTSGKRSQWKNETQIR